MVGPQSVSSGLEGVVVARTTLSDVDGERGRLILVGHDVETLALDARFEAALHLLERGALPDRAQEDQVRQQLGRSRRSAFDRLPALGDALTLADGMDALRASLSHLAPVADAKEQAGLLIGATAVFGAAWARAREGKAPVAPDPERSHAEDYLRMLSDAGPPDALVRALDTYLVTVCEHGMNASTFAARVIASTGSDAVSAVVGALGALKGPLHGGAPGPVLDMLDAVGEPDRAVPWLEQEVAAGRRIMGMGHRIYRVRDPRAAVLERAVERLERAGVRTGRLALARAVERAAEGVLAARHPDRALRVNVEFYTAILLDALGVPRAAFSPTFAVGRVAGWLAHIAEQRRTGRLIRPGSLYTGPIPATESPATLALDAATPAPRMSP